MRPLFLTCTARGGSYLNAQILSVNSQVNIASEPFLEFFRSFRNSSLKKSGINTLTGDPLEQTPFHDYYYTSQFSQIIDVMNKADLNIECTEDEWERVLKVQIPRIALQCAELQPFLKEMKGKTYKAIFDNALSAIQKARNVTNKKWIGIKDAWVIETFLPLARAYPDAKFIVIVRDVRASIASNLLVKNKSMIAHVASFAKAWRKNIAYTSFLRTQKLMKDRLFVISYEKLVNQPETEVRKVCEFLEIDFESSMLDTEKFIDFSTGKTWVGNSSYEEVTRGISPHRIDRWRESLPEDAKCAVEMIVGNDLRLIGREPTTNCFDAQIQESALKFLVSDNDGYKDWRTDTKKPVYELSREISRNLMLSKQLINFDETDLRENFLFSESYEGLKNNSIIVD